MSVLTGALSQSELMDRKDLGLGDHDLDVHVILHGRYLAVLHDGTEMAHRVDGLLERDPMLRRGGQLILPHAAKHADPQSADVARKSAMKIRDDLFGTVAVGGIVSSDFLQHDRAVRHCPGHRPTVIQRVGVGHHASPADQACARHEPGDSAKGCGAADRASGICSQRAGNKARCHGGPGPARRASGDPVKRPGVTHRGPGQVERWPAMGELVRCQLAQEQRPSCIQAFDDRRVALWNMVSGCARSARGRDPRRLEDILRTKGDAVHRSAVPSRHDFLLGAQRLPAGMVDRRGDEGMDLRINVPQALGEDVDVLDR